MRAKVDEQAHLLSANNRLRYAVYLISVQQARVENLTAAGLNAALAEDLLCLMNAILRNFIRHRQLILDSIERGHQ
ncbi:hypothetical protein C0Z18_02005 [Trinickia dabaoshanensis]|uniref:Uncharacterized protein n=1 Tax=Trinickia dabaoshanensis TaxID=564714 RepID=A0A2N7W1L3_9BURK|nr:hypothetical protein [Trinickia dabaoshanensis]PMS23297.1 hypothetical protein C0Z18_02005 [Trinickia dabaoshanensis]